MTLRHLCVTALLLVCGLPGQGPSEKAVAEGRELVSEKRVTEVLAHLASDELAGRGTPSKGQEQAADYIASAFRKAGLKAPSGKSYFQTFALPGMVTDSSQVEVTLHLAKGGDGVVLKGGKDVKVYRAPRRGYSADVTEISVVAEEKANLLRRAASRKPVLLVVDEEKSTLWKSIDVARRTLLRGRGLSRVPILLVRKSAMPEGDIQHAEVTVPKAKEVSIELKNVVGILPGEDGADEYVILSAHYDHLGIGLPSSGDPIYNGADDDATGTTAVLALAEAYARAGVKPKRNLAFVCFTAEEMGMRGSRAFVAKPPFPLDKVVANVNIEMIGRPDEIQKRAAWVTGKEFSDFAAIAGPALERAGIGLVDHRMARALFSGSDNITLAQKGVVAHSISAGSLHSDYHRVTDEVSTIDLPHMTAVIRGLYEVGLEFANRAEPPKYNERGRRALKLDN